MSKDTRILILEDVATDAHLIERELRKANVAFMTKHVETKESFKEALAEFRPDIVLSDYKLPQFSGLEAFRLLKELGFQIPFILVTGSLTEEVAVECMKEGIHDYILKTSLTRLPSAVLKALEKTRAELERAKTEAALHRSEELYRLITENSSDLICMLDRSGNYEYVSPSFKEVLGYATEELTGRNSFSLVHPDDCQRVVERFALSLKGKKPETIEFRFQNSDGNWRIFEAVVNWISDGEGRPHRTIVVSRDLTERKEAEQALRSSEDQLRQSQKLEAIGQLAGGVAHDFNNLLTVITGYSDLIIRNVAETDPNRSKIQEIRKAAERASSLTRQLLAFSRKQILQPKVFSLNNLVVDMGKMLRRLIGEDIEFLTVLTAEDAEINADPGQIEQVLMNLVVNARDAMSDGGRITIETTLVEIDQTYADTHIAIQPGSYVMLVVGDNGCGMDAETRKHIFEPFFTTKPQGKGTGLGLSTTYGIVKQSGGNIWVYSEPGHGATFKVYLPRAGQLEGSTFQSLGQKIEVLGGDETILLVEDEPQIQQMAHEFLTQCGYNVLTHANGLEALQALAQAQGFIHLLLTDLVMPQMNGRELAERVTLVKPDIRVLYMSGYTNDAVFRLGVLDSETWFIEKPFSTDSLARKIREVLDSDGHPREIAETFSQHDMAPDGTISAGDESTAPNQLLTQ